MTGLYWEWIVQRGRAFGKTIDADYTEVHFEELVKHPRETLAQIGAVHRSQSGLRAYPESWHWVSE